MSETSELYNLRAERVRRGLSAEEVADGIGVSKWKLYRWETKRSSPSIRDTVAICDYYGVTPDFVAGMTDDPHGVATYAR